MDLQTLLDRRALGLSSSSLKVVPALLEGDPHHAVSIFAETHAPSLVVLGTHGDARMERGLSGSVAEKILRSTGWPSFTVGPQAPSVSSSSVALPFKRIRRATDFSPAAARANGYVLSFVETLGADIDVLYVVPETVIEHPDRLADIRSRFSDALEQFVPERAKNFSNPRTFVETGNTHDRILKHIKDRSIDLLVLGIRKTSRLSVKMRTSGAFRIIAEALCPVLTITR
jgi:nucleotide-binding universal stress UspA family protein